MGYQRRDQVQNIEQNVPKFIREFRERTGQAGKDVVDINSKRQPVRKEREEESDGDTERPEEAPLICVGKGVSEEEALTFTKEKFGDEAVEKSDLKRKHDDGEISNGDANGPSDGKFVFKKPTKDADANKSKKTKKKVKSDMPKVKNKTLLSFGDEEEDEEDGT